MLIYILNIGMLVFGMCLSITEVRKAVIWQAAAFDTKIATALATASASSSQTGSGTSTASATAVSQVETYALEDFCGEVYPLRDRLVALFVAYMVLILGMNIALRAPPM